MKKEHRMLLRQSVLIVCLVVLAFQFKGSFSDLIEIVETNNPYETVGLQPQIELSLNQDNITTSTMKIFTYKLFETILLLFGVFSCLIFLAVNNKEFSLIELAQEVNK